MNNYLVYYNYPKENLNQMEQLNGNWTPPAGIKVLGKYAITGQHRGFVVIECKDHKLLAKYCREWRGVADLEILPIHPLK